MIIANLIINMQCNDLDIIDRISDNNYNNCRHKNIKNNNKLQQQQINCNNSNNRYI